MTNKNLDLLIKEYDFLSNSLNNIFKKTDTEIKNLLLKKNIKTRNNKITFSDVLLYKFLYAYKNDSKQFITSTLNFDNKLSINRTTYHKKDLLIPSDFYKDLFNQIRNLYNEHFKSDDKFNIIAVDGTYNNTNVDNIKNKLETSINMGYYLINECIPIDINFCNQENKNKEILLLKKYINENKDFDNYKNIIIVADRAYDSYKLINFLNDQKLNYVIRIKNNSLSIKDKNNIKNKINNYDSIRIITYKDEIICNHKDKDNKDVKLKEKIFCNIITNLNITDFNDEQIKKVYLSRWSIEVFFKLLKSNFKFSNLKEHYKKNTSDQYNKLYYSIMIIIYISTMIDKINDKYNKKYNKSKKKDKDDEKIKKNNKKYNKSKKKDKEKEEINNKEKEEINNKEKEEKNNKNNYNIKTNKSVLINGIKLILNDIIHANINKDNLLEISKNFIIKINIIKDVSNERKHPILNGIYKVMLLNIDILL